MTSDYRPSPPVDYKPRTVQSVSHAIDLLKAMSQLLVAPTLSELARSVHLSKPATYNLLNTLISEGLVVRDTHARYRLSWGMYELGSVIDFSEGLKQASRFALDRLAVRTGGASLLSVLLGKSVLYLDRGQVNPEFAMVASAGRRSSLHTNASGKVLLAHQSDAFIHQYLAGPLKQRTTTTITDPARLLTELSRVRAEGYGAAWGEQEPQVSSLAVPILDADGTIRASLAVAVPTAILMKISRAGLVSRMRDEAAKITEGMSRLP